ncbi:hypothetical protein HDU80_007547, partial [Chytriomyces hyalinus]
MNDQEQPPAVDVQPEALPQQDPPLHYANIHELALTLQRLYQHTPTTAPAPAAAPVDPPIPQVHCNFRLPTIKPLPFSRVYGNKPAHKIQNLIDNYLKCSYEFCLLHPLAPSSAKISHPNQPTYVQFSINDTVNSSTGYTPFYLKYSGHPRSMININMPFSAPLSIKEVCAEYQVVKDRIRDSQDKYAAIANCKCLCSLFQVGDLVLISAKEFKPPNLCYRQTNKLSKQYSGPYKIIELIGA